MKKMIPFILFSIALASCSESKPFLVGKNHQLVLGNPRIVRQNEQKKMNTIAAKKLAQKIN